MLSQWFAAAHSAGERGITALGLPLFLSVVNLQMGSEFL
jgi:hypothetical protein